MAVSLFNCWNCDKKLAGKKLTKAKSSVELFFYCDRKCKNEHEKASESNTRPYHQWSAFKAGEREKPPRKLAHLAEKWGPRPEKQDTAMVSVDETEGKPKGRRCGKCGEVGHNARTCGRQKTKKKKPRKGKACKSPAAPKKVRAKKGRKPKKRRTTKRARRRQYTCGKCGQKGHNARTCGKG